MEYLSTSNPFGRVLKPSTLSMTDPFFLIGKRPAPIKSYSKQLRGLLGSEQYPVESITQIYAPWGAVPVDHTNAPFRRQHLPFRLRSVRHL